METIKLENIINADPAVCFDLSRSIDLHVSSMQDSGEKAIAGVTTGLIGLNETVTWQARHFGLMFNLTTKITAFNPPTAFIDEQVNGPFKWLKHQHLFEASDNGGTLMTDNFEFQSPFGILGKFTDRFILKRHLTKLLIHRNRIIKIFAENKSTTYGSFKEPEQIK